MIIFKLVAGISSEVYGYRGAVVVVASHPDTSGNKEGRCRCCFQTFAKRPE
jgi:hypothetical protein